MPAAAPTRATGMGRPIRSPRPRPSPVPSRIAATIVIPA